MKGIDIDYAFFQSNIPVQLTHFSTEEKKLGRRIFEVFWCFH